MRFIYTKTFIKIFAVFLLLAVFVILNLSGYLNWVKDWFAQSYGFTSSKVAQTTSSIKSGFNTVFTIKNLARDNALLNQEIDQLAFENARLKSAREENLILRKTLNFRQESTLNLLPVEVLVLDPTGFVQSLVLSKGEKDGVRVNQPVVVAPGLLVGKITKTYSDSAEATLITDPSLLVNAQVVDTGALGLVRGEHGLSLLFDLVTQNEVVKLGDTVTTSGLSNDYPPGLLIGEISALRSNESDLFQKAYITPSANLRNLKFLFVVL